jgi:hypothetical protein
MYSFLFLLRKDWVQGRKKNMNITYFEVHSNNKQQKTGKVTKNCGAVVRDPSAGPEVVLKKKKKKLRKKRKFRKMLIPSSSPFFLDDGHRSASDVYVPARGHRAAEGRPELLEEVWHLHFSLGQNPNQCRRKHGILVVRPETFL